MTLLRNFQVVFSDDHSPLLLYVIHCSFCSPLFLTGGLRLGESSEATSAAPEEVVITWPVSVEVDIPAADPATPTTSRFCRFKVVGSQVPFQESLSHPTFDGPE